MGLPGKNLGQLRKVPVGKDKWVIFSLAQARAVGEGVNSASHPASPTQPQKYKHTYAHAALDSYRHTYKGTHKQTYNKHIQVQNDPPRNITGAPNCRDTHIVKTQDFKKHTHTPHHRHEHAHRHVHPKAQIHSWADDAKDK